jgi:phosphoserine aminotransferase
MKENGKAAYLDTGTSAGAIKEAKPFGDRCCFFKRRKLQSHSKDTVPNDANYFHCTSNNTIFELK